MDEFAQSREDDDLFADDIEPVSQTATIVHEAPEPVSDHTQPINTGAGENNKSAGPTDPGRTHTHTRRGQGQQDARHRGGTGSNGLQQSSYAQQHEPAPAAALNTASEATEISAGDRETTSSNLQDPSSQPPASPEPKPAPPPLLSTRTPAVRGDRSATGGPVHKKLTEEQLTAKLEKMAILDAQKAERHRLSQADQAAFQHQEEELAKDRREKRVKEQKNSRQMETERAKNRRRKLQSQGGREWDSEKVESDIVDGKGRARKSEYVRGNHGGVIQGKGIGLAGSRYAAMEGDKALDGPGAVHEGYDSAAKGRGGFEIRGRGGRGRGGYGRKPSSQSQTIPAVEDFPSLPTPSRSSPGVNAKEESKSSTAGQASGEWADEMATPVEEKKMVI